MRLYDLLEGLTIAKASGVSSEMRIRFTEGSELCIPWSKDGNVPYLIPSERM